MVHSKDFRVLLQRDIDKLGDEIAKCRLDPNVEPYMANICTSLLRIANLLELQYLVGNQEN